MAMEKQYERRSQTETRRAEELQTSGNWLQPHPEGRGSQAAQQQIGLTEHSDKDRPFSQQYLVFRSTAIGDLIAPKEMKPKLVLSL